MIEIAHPRALDGINAADLELDGFDPALFDQSAGSLQNLQFRPFDIDLEKLDFPDATALGKLLDGHDLRVISRQRDKATRLQDVWMARGAFRPILKCKVEEFAIAAQRAAGKRQCYKIMVLSGPLQDFEAERMRLKAIDDRPGTVAPDNFRIFAVIGADIQDNRKLGSPEKERLQERFFAANGVIAPVLEAETAQR